MTTHSPAAPAQAISGVALAGHSNYHMWFRLALVSSDHSTATLFDDLSQVPPALMQRSLSTSGSLKQLRESGSGAVLRSAIPMKNTILKIALANRKQVGGLAGGLAGWQAGGLAGSLWAYAGSACWFLLHLGWPTGSRWGGWRSGGQIASTCWHFFVSVPVTAALASRQQPLQKLLCRPLPPDMGT